MVRINNPEEYREDISNHSAEYDEAWLEGYRTALEKAAQIVETYIPPGETPVVCSRRELAQAIRSLGKIS